MIDNARCKIHDLPVHTLPLGRARCIAAPIEDAKMSTAVAFLQERFDEILDRDELLRQYLARMHAAGMTSVVFGGWVRDQIIELIHSRKCVPRDIDMVAHGPAGVASILGPNAVVNVFGGVGVAASSIHFEVWDLPDTFLIRKHSLPITFDTLPKTADYTCNALVFRPRQFFGTPSIQELGAFAAIHEQVIDFQADEVILPLIQAARSVILAAKLSFRLSHVVSDFLREVCASESSRAYIQEGLTRYCPEEHFGAAMTLLDRSAMAR